MLVAFVSEINDSQITRGRTVNRVNHWRGDEECPLLLGKGPKPWLTIDVHLDRSSSLADSRSPPRDWTPSERQPRGIDSSPLLRALVLTTSLLRSHDLPFPSGVPYSLPDDE